MVKDHGQVHRDVDRNQNGGCGESSDKIENIRSSRLRRSLNADQPALRAEVFSGLRNLKLAATVRAVGQG
jgi:hypothetical protein